MPIYLLTESGAQFHGHFLASSGDFSHAAADINRRARSSWTDL